MAAHALAIGRIALGALLLSNYAVAGDDEPRSNWAIVVRPFDGTAPAGSLRRYWIGVKNQSEQPRALCVTSVMYDREAREGWVETLGADGSPNGLSPHYCSQPSTRHLILPKETYFLLVGAGSIDTAAKEDPVFHVGAIELCADSSPCRDVPVALRSQLVSCNRDSQIK